MNDKMFKNFKFDLEMGVFKKYPFAKKQTAYLFKGNLEELKFLAVILIVLDFDMHGDFDSDDLIPTLLINTDEKKCWIGAVEDKEYENEIPDYMKEYLYNEHWLWSY